MTEREMVLQITLRVNGRIIYNIEALSIGNRRNNSADYDVVETVNQYRVKIRNFNRDDGALGLAQRVIGQIREKEEKLRR